MAREVFCIYDEKRLEYSFYPFKGKDRVSSIPVKTRSPVHYIREEPLLSESTIFRLY